MNRYLLVVAILCISSIAENASSCDCPTADSVNFERRLDDFPIYGTHTITVYFRVATADACSGSMLREYTRIYDPSAECEVTSDFTDAHKTGIKNGEDINLSDYPGVERVAEPSIKQNCHGATLGFQLWVEWGILCFLTNSGKTELTGAEIANATIAVHGDSKHSSYLISTQEFPVQGCNGKGSAKTTMYTGKWGHCSTLKTPAEAVYDAYNMREVNYY